MGDLSRLDAAICQLSDRLRERRVAAGHWEGVLSSSPLSTGTAILALHLADRERLRDAVAAGRGWLVDHQNADGGWGDTVRSRSNISTTAIVWAALSKIEASSACLSRAAEWLHEHAGGVSPQVLPA